jgi:hypothetical protein
MEKEAKLDLNTDPEMEAYLIRIMKKFRIINQLGSGTRIRSPARYISY